LWSRDYRPQADGSCVLASARPSLTITYRLPRPAGPLPPATQRLWDIFIAGVEKHERVHGEIILDMTRQIEAVSVGLRAENDPGCQKVRAELQRKLAGISEERHARNREFDRVELSEGGNVHQLVLALVNGFPRHKTQLTAGTKSVDKSVAKKKLPCGRCDGAVTAKGVINRPSTPSGAYPCHARKRGWGREARLLPAGFLKVGNQGVGISKARSAGGGDLVGLLHRLARHRVGHLELQRESLVGRHALKKQAHGVRYGQAHRLKCHGCPFSRIVLDTDMDFGCAGGHDDAYVAKENCPCCLRIPQYTIGRIGRESMPKKTILREHKRVKKRLVPPLLYALGDNYSPYSWARQLAPQVIWRYY
jgi:hypothetical protein